MWSGDFWSKTVLIEENKLFTLFFGGLLDSCVVVEKAEEEAKNRTFLFLKGNTYPLHVVEEDELDSCAKP